MKKTPLRHCYILGWYAPWGESIENKTIIFATEFTYNLSNKIALYKVKNIIDKENLKNIIKLNRPPRGGVVNGGKSNEWWKKKSSAIFKNCKRANRWNYKDDIRWKILCRYI